MGILDTVNARLEIKKNERSSQLTPNNTVIRKDFAWLNQVDYSGNQAARDAAKQARQAAKLPKKPYLG